MSTTTLPVVILAGGLATRLQDLTRTLPKSLIPIQGVPFIDHQLHLLHRNGLKRVILCLGHLGASIIAHVGNGRRYGLDIEYVEDGVCLRGTGGALKLVLPLVDSPFFVLYGDSYLPCDYQAIQRIFYQKPTLGLMTVFHNEGRWDASNIEYRAGAILDYNKEQKTSRMHFIDYGLGILTPQALEYIPDTEPYDLAQLYRSLLKKNQLAATEVTQRFYEIGSYQGIRDLDAYFEHG